MPDPPPAKRQPLRSPTVDPRSPARRTRYAELRCRTNFSFLEGASHPDELVHRAAELGYAALAITDRNSLAGIVRAHTAAKELGLKLLVGAEVTPIDAPPAVLLAMDRAGYGRLCQLITRGRRAAPKGECRLTFADVAEHADGLMACVAACEGSGVQNSIVPAEVLANLHTLEPEKLNSGHPTPLHPYRNAFRDRCYALAELHAGPNDRRRLAALMRMARAARVPLVAANDVHYHEPERRFLQDVLTAIRHGCTVAELGARGFPNAERYLKPPETMAALFAEYPDAIARTIEIADRCTFSLDELRYEYPEELCPPGTTPLEYLKRLAWEGAYRRYPGGVPDKVRGLIEHELALIAELRYEAYFLTVWDLVRFARSRGILCQGRGSAANSAVCFCLEVTSVDPDRIDVLFERFVSKERNEAPDIDVDFEHERREEVIQYVYEKYGRERAGMAATVITYRPRSAVRDVGKALGFSLDRVDTLAKTLEHYNENEKLTARFREAGVNPASRLARQLIHLVRQILGFPRHLSQHVGGLVMTQGLLCEYVPIENAAMPGRTVIQWDKDDLDAVGLLKVDCLALGMLTAVHRAFALLGLHYPQVVRELSGRGSGVQNSILPVQADENRQGLRSAKLNFEHPTPPPLSLADIPPEDPAVYKMIQRGDTLGVFQIESRAQMAMLPRLRPRCFYDLVIEVAIVRPGPIQGDMVHPYLRRRCGEERVEYPDDRIRAVLEKTLGVPIFQEQAMRLAVVAAGFTPGEADQLRRAMGAWRRHGAIDGFRTKLIDGMQANGYTAEFGERLFNQIRGFGEYGFPESHAASFALLVYVSAWIKRHFPDVFAAALLNSQPMGFYAPAQLVGDARQHGVEVRPIDVNASGWDCLLEPGSGVQNSILPGGVLGNLRTFEPAKLNFGHPTPSPRALRLGFRLIRGLRQADTERIVRERESGGPFASFDDFARRTRLSSAVLTRLSKADAFNSLGLDRRQAQWQSLPEQRVLPLFDEVPVVRRPSSVIIPYADPSSQRTTDNEQRTTSDEPAVSLPPIPPLDQVAADYRAAGLSLREHPLSFFRAQLERRGVVRAADLATWPNERKVRVAGLVLLRQRPGTASGITFVTIEDETGFANLIVRPDVWERFHHAARTAKALLVRGLLQRLHGVIHVLADHLEDLSPLLAHVRSDSRDFR